MYRRTITMILLLKLTAKTSNMIHEFTGIKN